MEKIITALSAILAVMTFIYKVITDQRNYRQKLEQELREKRTQEYLKFLETLSKFVGNTEFPEAKRNLLQLCYTMILVCKAPLRKNVEELLEAVLCMTRGDIDEEQFKSKIGEKHENSPNIVKNIIQLMREDLTKEEDKIQFNLWVEAIEFLNAKENVVIHGDSGDEESEVQYFWINSCERYYPGAWKKMLKHNIACTYGPIEYGEKLQRIEEEDIVFLYLSGKGIIACGTVTKAFSGEATSNPKTVDKSKETEYSIGVKWEFQGNEDKYISPSEIKHIGHSVFFPTLMKLDAAHGEILYEKAQAKFAR